MGTSTPYNINNDEWLISRCRKEDERAQKVVFNAWGETMLMVCYRYIGNIEEAQEVMHDGFLTFFKNLDKFTYRGEGSAKAWLKKILVNQCLMHLRKKTIFQVELVEAEHADVHISSNAIGNMSVKEIILLIQKLPDGYRTVFNLYVFEQMNHKEIGEQLGIAESTSKSQLHKARAVLQKQLTILK